MKAEQRGDDCLLTLSKAELMVIISALGELRSLVPDTDFEDRVGVDPERFHELTEAMVGIARKIPAPVTMPSGPYTFPLRVDREVFLVIGRTAAIRGTSANGALRHLLHLPPSDTAKQDTADTTRDDT
ncbi:hypothetical protein [Actinoplanes utahensis]|uniref:Uncharacterized protein n=1 Tax=Actinoplanes utahensis TaxID=1869 RepID=A0A0A6UE93_ACTUT|nr:hypothetical protein [Actinoplanes utahensis]KHD74340.1 hypothetical protein MB27_29130 [Actinoplanes utahensis]GIF35294.1 hypothetical protein Aut01nite_82800 [Actinoplanes utahensis]